MLASSSADDGRREWPIPAQETSLLYTQAGPPMASFFGRPSPLSLRCRAGLG
jgi:hypothetical protein